MRLILLASSHTTDRRWQTAWRAAWSRLIRWRADRCARGSTHVVPACTRLTGTGAQVTEEELKERQERALADPEIQMILTDPVMRQVLNDFSTDPKAAQVCAVMAAALKSLHVTLLHTRALSAAPRQEPHHHGEAAEAHQCRHGSCGVSRQQTCDWGTYIARVRHACARRHCAHGLMHGAAVMQTDKFCSHACFSSKAAAVVSSGAAPVFALQVCPQRLHARIHVKHTCHRRPCHLPIVALALSCGGKGEQAQVDAPAPPRATGTHTIRLGHPQSSLGCMTRRSQSSSKTA